ncbi:MAG TPA: hypothetical protein VEL68_17500 [Thermodesulfobacteriota bacterium]|nr:hypothetical protein [Thermodesulfobacteriota bacterium]
MNMIEKLPELVNGNERLVWRGRFLTVDFLIEVGDVSYLVSIQAGRIVSVEQGPFYMRPWRFAVRASATAWEKLWEPMPRPGYTDILGLMRRGEARIEGDLQPLVANLRYVKEVLVTPRRLKGGC